MGWQVLWLGADKGSKQESKLGVWIERWARPGGLVLVLFAQAPMSAFGAQLLEGKKVRRPTPHWFACASCFTPQIQARPPACSPAEAMIE